jgi:Tol biopolymer transport system component
MAVPRVQALFFLTTCLVIHQVHAAEIPAPTASETQITTDGFPKRDPVFWPGGKELVYTVEAETGHMRIVRRDLSDGTVTLFDQQPNRSDREMSVSADGKVYAFNVVSGLSSKIHVVDKVRNKSLTMPQMGKKTWSNWPSVSPDGTRVLFTEGAAVIYVFDLRTANGKASVMRLSPQGSPTASDYWPHFSPDGESIVFTTNRDDDYEIYVMNSDGSVQRRLTESPGIDMHPRWSPDGKRIAFTSNRDGNYEIYVMNRDGSGQVRVTTNPERDDYVCWTPPGDALVFVSERDGRFDLYQREIR